MGCPGNRRPLPGGAKTSVLPTNPTPGSVSASRRFKKRSISVASLRSRALAKLRSGDDSSSSDSRHGGWVLTTAEMGHNRTHALQRKAGGTTSGLRRLLICGKCAILCSPAHHAWSVLPTLLIQEGAFRPSLNQTGDDHDDDQDQTDRSRARRDGGLHDHDDACRQRLGWWWTCTCGVAYPGGAAYTYRPSASVGARYSYRPSANVTYPCRATFTSPSPAGVAAEPTASRWTRGDWLWRQPIWRGQRWQQRWRYCVMLVERQPLRRTRGGVLSGTTSAARAVRAAFFPSAQRPEHR
jgi:hypothetical protein